MLPQIEVTKSMLLTGTKNIRLECIGKGNISIDIPYETNYANKAIITMAPRDEGQQTWLSLTSEQVFSDEIQIVGIKYQNLKGVKKI